MNKLRLTGLLLTRLLGLWLVCASCVQSGYAQQSGGGNYPTGNGVRVREVDGSPNVPGTQTLVFPNGSLTRAGQTVTVTIAGGTTINSTNGQVPYRSNSTTFADSGIVYSSGMIGIQVTPTAAQLEINSQSTTRPSLKLRALAATPSSQNAFESYDAAGSLVFSITADGRVTSTAATTSTFSGRLQSNNYETTNVAGYIAFNGRSSISTSADGVFELANYAGTGFTRLNLGPASASFPSLKRSSTTIQVRLANDSDDAPLTASVLGHKAYTVAGLPAASSFTGYTAYVTDANATTRLSTVAGGGSNKVIVFSDGTNWLIL